MGGAMVALKYGHQKSSYPDLQTRPGPPLKKTPLGGSSTGIFGGLVLGLTIGAYKPAPPPPLPSSLLDLFPYALLGTLAVLPVVIVAAKLVFEPSKPPDTGFEEPEAGYEKPVGPFFGQEEVPPMCTTNSGKRSGDYFSFSGGTAVGVLLRPRKRSRAHPHTRGNNKYTWTQGNNERIRARTRSST
jgi:hypothetical protein